MQIVLEQNIEDKFQTKKEQKSISRRRQRSVTKSFNQIFKGGVCRCHKTSQLGDKLFDYEYILKYVCLNIQVNLFNHMLAMLLIYWRPIESEYCVSK